MIPLIKLLAPNSVTKLEELGNAMINSVSKGYDKQIIEVKDIRALSNNVPLLKI